MRAPEGERIWLEEARNAAEQRSTNRTVLARAQASSTDASSQALLASAARIHCSLASRLSGSLPAIRLALMAPIEVPMIQSGSMPASCSA